MKALNQIFEIHTEKGEWAKLNLKDECWEYQADLNDEETYDEGEIIIEDGIIIDYDGCYELPKLIQEIIKKNNIENDLLFF